jgi:hypothetical protein
MNRVLRHALARLADAGPAASCRARDGEVEAAHLLVGEAAGLAIDLSDLLPRAGQNAAVSLPPRHHLDLDLVRGWIAPPQSQSTQYTPS